MLNKEKRIVAKSSLGFKNPKPKKPKYTVIFQRTLISLIFEINALPEGHRVQGGHVYDGTYYSVLVRIDCDQEETK